MKDTAQTLVGIVTGIAFLYFLIISPVISPVIDYVKEPIRKFAVGVVADFSNEVSEFNSDVDSVRASKLKNDPVRTGNR